jgi:hypothetical protein
MKRHNNIYIGSVVVSFLFLVLSSTRVYSYSMFSSQGFGEPTTDIRLVKIDIPQDWTFGIDFTGELLKTYHGNANVSNFDFTVPSIEWQLPLPKGLGIAISMNEILNLNYDILSPTGKIGSDSVFRNIKSRGSVSTVNIVGGKKFDGFATAEVGGFLLFGSADEEWKTNFIRYNSVTDTAVFYDTLSSEFSGAGIIGNVGLKMGNLELGINYCSESNLSSLGKLPQRIKTSLVYSFNSDIKIGFGTEDWLFPKPYVSLSKQSIIGEYGKKTAFRAGVYKKDWYYGDIKEQGGLLGITLPFKSMLKIGLTGEYGERNNGVFYEKVYKAYLTMQGREDF